MRVPNIVDARKLYDPEDFKDVNFVAIGLGVEPPLCQRAREHS